jgi:predicted signal transduction protein with EAL and GGDEF domain
LEGLALTLGRQYQIKTAPSGKAALEILREMPQMTVIISDMRMPNMNGAQFLAASRQIAPNARRILLTGHADVATAILAVNEGAIFRFLTKPCPSAKLIEAVEAAIADLDDEALERSAIRRTVRKDVLSQDSLTGLASREILLERLDRCRGAGEPGDWRAEVIFVIEISDAEELSGLDSKSADRLIRALAMKLRDSLPNADCLARYRETTFVALIAPVDGSDANLELLAENIVTRLEQPVDLDGALLQTRATVGIARIPAETADPHSSLRYAELAAREATRLGNNPVRFFSRDSIIRNERRRDTIQALRAAITQQQLSLYYQPIIDIERNSVYSIEALARWEHVQLGFVSPGTFIPLAEETGLMIPLGEWVMNRACADARSLLGPEFSRVSVNVSVAQILDGKFMRILYQSLEASRLDPAALELELTETVFAEDLDRVCKLLSEVRLLGVRVAIDDFGAGYSSLAYLTRLPVDVLKIDRTFVQDFARGGEAIIGAALAVAHTLKLEVIVEGIETAAELERVRTLGATKIQGFLFARPMPAAELSSWYAGFAKLGGGV